MNIGGLGLDDRGKEKLKTFIQGRPEEGQTMRLINEAMRGRNGKFITYRDYIQQARFETFYSLAEMARDK